MTPTLSPNTQAILLLTAPLITGRNPTSSDLLKPSEYKNLVRHLRKLQLSPADLILPDSAENLRACDSVIDKNRLQNLLSRGFQLSQAIEHWHARAIWVVSRADAKYPRRFKERLNEDSPAVLYGCGDINLLGTGGLAVVGSRHVDNTLIDYTLSVGQIAARAARTIISGGARGIDQAAMRGALEAGGHVCGVLADSLEKTVMNRENRNLLLNEQLVLISPYDPKAGFNVGNAMQRNKLIYALADASLVVSSDLKKGGTWNGAIEQLDKLKFVPVFVRSTGVLSEGLDALRNKGAIPWPNPQDTEAFKGIFDEKISTLTLPEQSGLLLFPIEDPSPIVQMPAFDQPTTFETPNELVLATHTLTEELDKPELGSSLAALCQISENPSTPSDILFATVRKVIEILLRTPMKDADVAAALDVSNAQAKLWLQRLVDDGLIEKQKKPAGYIVKQPTFFE